MGPIRPIGLILLALARYASNVNAAEPANFYQGKTVRIVVGLAAGGGYDLYARTLARHLGKHIPGNPSIVVDNMTASPSDTTWAALRCNNCSPNPASSSTH